MRSNSKIKLLAAPNKAYALHSLSLVRATPHRTRSRAMSHKKNVGQKWRATIPKRQEKRNDKTAGTHQIQLHGWMYSI